MKKKIKGSLTKPEPSVIVAAAALSLCALLPLRVYQVSALIDPETGFFTQSSFTVPLFYVLLAVVVIAVMVTSYLNNKAGRARDLTVKSKPLGIVSAITAFTLMFDAVYQMYSYIEIKAEYNPMTEQLTQSQYLSKSGATIMLLQAVFGVFAAFFFWIYTVACFSGKTKLKGYKLLSIAPILWAICRIIIRFIRKISFINISDLLLELFMLVFIITFTLAFAQVVTKVTPEIVAWRLYGCGIPAALLAFLISVPRLFLIIIGHADSLVPNYGFNPCDLAFALFIPMFLYNTATAKKAEESKA